MAESATPTERDWVAKVIECVKLLLETAQLHIPRNY